MTNEIRLKWEPQGFVSPDLILTQVMKYMDDEATFAQFPAGTCLMLKPVDDIDATIKGAMIESRRIADFKVYPMRDGDYLVFFASALLVYVGKDEFLNMKDQIVDRVDDLKFDGEAIASPVTPMEVDDIFVGLYARGKLQCDAWGVGNYVIVKPSIPANRI